MARGRVDAALAADLTIRRGSRCLERSTAGQATTSGVVKGVCGVGLRSRPIFDRQFFSQSDLSTRSGPRHKQSTPQTPFTMTRPTSGTPRRRRND